MASRIRLVKMGALLLSQFSLLLALNFQLFGMVAAYKMMEHKLNLSLVTYMSARKSLYLHRKKKASSSLPCSSKGQVGLGDKWTHRPMVAKYDRGRCSRLVLEEKISYI